MEKNRESIIATSDPYTVSVMKRKEVVGNVPSRILGCVPLVELADILNVP